MSIGSRIRRFLSRLVAPAELKSGRGWTFPIVGESHYQKELAWLSRETEPNAKLDAELTPEVWNRHDANAVMVRIQEVTVGYLSREHAAEYRRRLGAIRSGCSAKITGGFEKDDGTTANYGVKLNLKWPPAIN